MVLTCPLQTASAQGHARPRSPQQFVPERLALSDAGHLAAARVALTNGHPQKALPVLQRLVDTRPDFTTAGGTAAYWLGQAHVVEGDSQAAHAAWRAGVNALAARDRTDARLFDAYITSVFRQGIQDEKSSAADAYLRLLAGAGPRAPDPVRRHMAHLVPLWPEERQSALASDPERLQDGTGDLQPGAGTAAVRWWRRQDPRPATPRNERVIEHLQRIEDAQRQFAADTFAGYDERGRIYVRLGPPDQRRTLSSQSLAKSLSAQAAFIPKNEYWFYEGFGRHSHYLFVRRGGQYVQGGVPDLLPTGMRRGVGQSGVLAVLALRDLYDALTPRVTEYYPLFDQVSDEVARLQSVASRNRTTVTQMADANLDPASGGARFGRLPVSFFERARLADREVEQKRAEEVPASHSNAAAREGGLPVALRTARFLNDDGTTRLEAYWSIRPDHLETDAVEEQLQRAGYDAARRHTIRLTARGYDEAYRAHAVEQWHHRLKADDRAAPPDAIPVVSVRLPPMDPGHTMALQWDQLVTPRGAPGRTALRSQSHVRWLDSLDVLPSDAGTLVLSDLVPLQAETLSGTDVRTDAGFQARPYPFATLDPDVQLGVYFEAYHLQFDADDRTRYTIEYTVRRKVPKGGIRGLFAGDRTETTTTQTTAEGRSRTAREYLELDLREVRDATALALIVRVTDEVSGQSAYQLLPFRMDDTLTD